MGVVSVGRFGIGAFAIAVVLWAPTPPAIAACTTSGSTVTCSGSTTNAGDGFGDGTQNNLTINVQPSASVTGTADDGFNLNDANTVNNSGTVTGGSAGISALGTVTVNNTSAGKIIGSGPGGIGISADVANVNNYGSISANGMFGTGVFGNTSANVLNYGSISASGMYGVGIDTGTANVTNYGTISGNTEGVDAFTANVINYGSISSAGAGGVQSIGVGFDNGSVINFGTISGRTSGITFNTGTATNSGTVTATGANGVGIKVSTDGTIINSGNISAAGANGIGIQADGGAITVNNSGNITANRTSGAGIAAQSGGTGDITNSGIVSGSVGVFSDGTGPGMILTNSGTIIGFNGPAINFSSSTGDTLNFLPGSRIVGDIWLGNSDTLNIHTGRDVAWLMPFGACGCGGIISTGSTVNFSGGGPYVLVGDQIATLDPTAFALADKSLMDFSGFISSLLGNRFGEFAFTGSTPTAFAPAYNGIVDGANTAIGNALAYAGDSRVPNAMAADRASGIAVWSKGFVGGRHQDADGPNLGAGSLAYGGAVGLDRQFTAALRLGAFLGAGNGRLNVDSGSQTVKTDYAFGGVYGRYNWAAQFLDFAVTGGSMGNSSNRTVADNINGLQTASASYNGWFVSPELATGIHIPQGANVVMTPTARIRYLAGGLDGYSEAGSAQNLTVASRVMQNVEERIELAFERTDPLKQGVLKTITTIGVLGQERLGSTTINTVLIGQPLSFAATGANDVAGGYLGLGFDYRMTQRINLFAAVEATVRSDLSQTGIAQGGLRIALD